jgi:predicted RNA-binding protein with PUA-like domain
MPSYWLIKVEPSVYPFAKLLEEGSTEWSGVRNFQARNNLRAMAPGDLALYYHSQEGKAVVGVAQITSAPYPDPTAPGEDWTAVKVGPVCTLKQEVTLAQVKAIKGLAKFPLVTHSRLSVAKVTSEHFKQILALGKTTLPKRR